MTKTLLPLFAVFAAALAAQDLGPTMPPPVDEESLVLLGGTTENPTIINRSRKAVIGWILTQWDSDGHPLASLGMLDLETILSSDAPGIQPGEERAIFGSNPNRIKGQKPVALRGLDSWLYITGEVAGPESLHDVFPALEQFSNHIRMLQSERPSLRTIRIPTPWQHHKGRPLVDRPPLWYPTIDNWTPNDSAAGTIYPPADGYVDTSSVTQDASCGMDSPYSGQTVGGTLGFEVGCYTGSDYYIVSVTATRRPDGQWDRIQQHAILKNPNDGHTQDNYQLTYACVIGDDGRVGDSHLNWWDKYPC